MNKSLSNFDKIKAAWRMGWAAVLKYDEDILHVVGMTHNFIQVIVHEGNAVIEWPNYKFEMMEVTGYLYAGELAGNEPIPEGQKFRNKTTGDIFALNFDFNNRQSKSIECPYCRGEGKWLSECCNGSNNCPCRGEPYFPSSCCFCNGTGKHLHDKSEIEPYFD